MADQQPTHELKKEIRLYDAVMLVAGTMIGSGIFIVSADIARNTGSAGYMLLAWLLTGLITMAGALSYGELAGMMPKSGGQYVFLREAYNPMVAFLYGWTLFLVIQSGTIAAVAVAFARFTGVLLPFFSETNLLLEIGSFKLSTVQVLAIASIILLTLINMGGVKNGTFIQNLFGSTKLIALFGLLFLGLLFGINPEVVQQNFSDMWTATQFVKLPSGETFFNSISGLALVPVLGVAMVGSLFSSDAWNNITFAGDEVVNPKRTIPLSLAIGTGLVTLLYLLLNLVYLLVLPLKGSANATDVLGRGIQFAANDRVAVAVAEAIGGNTATIFIAVLIMVSTFGCNNGCILSGARVYYAIAKDGLFFSQMAKVNRKGVPANALILQCIWACLLCLSGSYGSLLDYVMFAVVLFYILTIGGIFILRKKMPDTPRPYKALGYPFLPALYIVLTFTFNIILLIYKPEYTWTGLGIVLLGIPAYWFFRQQQKKVLKRT
jgi:basic amino acid/polyamine antiporter, APA family